MYSSNVFEPIANSFLKKCRQEASKSTAKTRLSTWINYFTHFSHFFFIHEISLRIAKGNLTRNKKIATRPLLHRHAEFRSFKLCVDDQELIESQLCKPNIQAERLNPDGCRQRKKVHSYINFTETKIPVVSCMRQIWYRT